MVHLHIRLIGLQHTPRGHGHKLLWISLREREREIGFGVNKELATPALHNAVVWSNKAVYN